LYVISSPEIAKQDESYAYLKFVMLDSCLQQAGVSASRFWIPFPKLRDGMTESFY
jgi:hypothetical protein